MNDVLISFETAKSAKEKGFDEITELNYISEGNPLWKVKSTVENFNGLKHSDGENFFYSAATQSLLQKWLREEHKINVESNFLPNIEKYSCIYVPMGLPKPNSNKSALHAWKSRKNYLSKNRYNTYEEALEEGLQQALLLLKS